VNIVIVGLNGHPTESYDNGWSLSRLEIKKEGDVGNPTPEADGNSN
jgi:hypothetical protein